MTRFVLQVVDAHERDAARVDEQPSDQVQCRLKQRTFVVFETGAAPMNVCLCGAACGRRACYKIYTFVQELELLALHAELERLRGVNTTLVCPCSSHSPFQCNPGCISACNSLWPAMKS